jgi:hypothetical protein
LVNQRSSSGRLRCPYLQLLCAPDKVGGQSLHQTLQVHALDALQVDKVIAARKEGSNDETEHATQTKDPKVLPLAIFTLALLLQCV